MRKIGLFDILLIILFFLILILASPYVAHQFIGLKKIGDILWNVALDAAMLTVLIIVFVFLAQLLNKFNRWS